MRGRWVVMRLVVLTCILMISGCQIDYAKLLNNEEQELTQVVNNGMDKLNQNLLAATEKGDKDRIVPFDEAFKKVFTAFVFNRPAHAGQWLLLGANGHRQPVGQMTTNAVRQAIRRRCKEARVDYFNPHSVPIP